MSTFVNNNIFQGTVSTGILGVSAGRAIYTNGPLPGNITSIKIVYTATATVGTRNVTCKILDSSSNVIWESPIPGSEVASSATQISFGPGCTVSSAGGIFTTCLSIPAYLPPNGFVVIFDVSNIDVNDVVSSGQIVVQY